MTEITATQNGWVLCHDSINILHIVSIKEGNKLATGQPYVEQFEEEVSAIERVRELAISMRFTEEEVESLIRENFYT